MPFPDDLPEWARALTYVIVAVGIGVGVIVARFGVLQGRRATPSNDPSKAEVAAVIVDSKALNAATDAVLALNGTMAHLADLIGQRLVDAREEREERERDEQVEAEVERRLKEREERDLDRQVEAEVERQIAERARRRRLPPKKKPNSPT